ncbi:MAG: hypothetical protein KF861_08435 [Planctomycetaceae bacterium]|nr:hypothetical protein [Planctomycetaceae bacterium]
MNLNLQRALDLLVCPQSHAPLVFDGRSLVSTDPESRLRYAIKDDIPIMLVDEAETVADNEWRDLMRQNNRDPQTGQPLSADVQ